MSRAVALRALLASSGLWGCDNNQGVAVRLSMLLEITATGAILPSFTQETVPTAIFRENRQDTSPGYWRFSYQVTFERIALACAIYFWSAAPHNTHATRDPTDPSRSHPHPPPPSPVVPRPPGPH